ncbi:conserved hypothetical protein, membrane [Candidatus Magnetobacterium bavaricum]|uniref:Glycosyltransferase RgtA/B/C/D-like domain-containing protein n=1 Tax=Candidatus Magnetobacterium bavaricum TaxID=29290 RepID=A0A0F3GWF6_9BACT|nr:conserved hypothetical protein, membrane [Candidatus Magnetobacterium bavaricum]
MLVVREILVVFFIFILSRLFVLFGVFFGLRFISAPQATAAGVINYKQWWLSLLQYDTGFYLSVINEGYNFVNDGVGVYNTIIFPLYPLSVRYLAIFFSADVVMTGLILSNACFLVALVILFYYVKGHYKDVDPTLSVILMSVFPSGVIFSTMYAESLFLLLAVVSFYMFYEKRYIPASLALSLLGATKLQGLFVLPSLALPYLIKLVFPLSNKRLKTDPNGVFRFLGWLTVSLTGVIAFGIYLKLRFGFWNAFILAQQYGWHRKIGDWARLLTELKPDPNIIMHIVPAFIILTSAIVFMFTKNYRRYVLWGLCTVLIPLSSGSFLGMNRYMIVYFPMVIFISGLSNRSVYVRDFFVAMFFTGSFVTTVIYTKGYFLG